MKDYAKGHKALSRKQAQEEVGKIGNFRVAPMSGGYVALWIGASQIAAWVTPEQAVAMAKDCKSVIARETQK